MVVIEVAVWQCEWWWRSGLEGGRALKPAGRFSEPGVRALEAYGKVSETAGMT